MSGWEYREVIIFERWTFRAEDAGQHSRRRTRGAASAFLAGVDGPLLATLARRAAAALPLVAGLAAGGLTAAGARALRGRGGRALPSSRRPPALPAPAERGD